jgi:hypothetical protein
MIEKVVGSASGYDVIKTGGAANILQPGPGKGGASLADFGGCNSTTGCSTPIPVSNDTYSGFSASGYGTVNITDYGGTADKLILPFASTDAYFEASDGDSDGSADALLIMSTSTDSVRITGQLEPYFGRLGRIETIQFTDGTFSIGSASATSSSAASATRTSPASQVEALNAASTIGASEKDKRAKAAKKILSEAPSPPTSPEDIKPPK